jgi:hypothetical protein
MLSSSSSRITPGDPYMLAIQKQNVDVHFTEVVEITDSSIVGKNGTKRDIDTIICATGKSCPTMLQNLSI